LVQACLGERGTFPPIAILLIAFCDNTMLISSLVLAMLAQVGFAQLLIPSSKDLASKLKAEPAALDLASASSEVKAASVELPGVPANSFPDLRTKGLATACSGKDAPQYSGYLPAGAGDSYFYWLATSRSQTPEADPLILWMTGGPGCASTAAFLMENGPCRVSSDETDGQLKTSRNPWSWTETANVLWVDQPGGVGFSSASSLVLIGEEVQVADRMFAFIMEFLKKFPHFSKVPFFVIGESYAGHYVPSVSARVLKGMQEGAEVQLAGVGIGNGLVDPVPQFESKPIMAFTGGSGGSLHGGVVNSTVFAQMKQSLPKCAALIEDCQRDQMPGTCIEAMTLCATDQVLPVAHSGKNPYDLRKPCVSPPLCYNTSLLTDFLNNPRTQTALGVPIGTKWKMCNMQATLPFLFSGDYLIDSEPSVLRLLKAGIRVLVYNGDTDFMVDWVGTKAWMEQFKWSHQHAWRSTPDTDFIVDGKVAGKQRSSNGLTFVQIYNAGHLVPMDQPKVALTMVQELLSKNSPWASPKPHESIAVSTAEVLEPSHPGLLIIGVFTMVVSLLGLVLWSAQLIQRTLRQSQRPHEGYILVA